MEPGQVSARQMAAFNGKLARGRRSNEQKNSFATDKYEIEQNCGNYIEKYKCFGRNQWN